VRPSAIVEVLAGGFRNDDARHERSGILEWHETTGARGGEALMRASTNTARTTRRSTSTSALPLLVKPVSWSPTIARQTLLRFTDALAWTWIVGNPDGHARTYSILIAGRELRLAPLYDHAAVRSRRALHSC
jgi:hypothetical protein